MDPSPDVQAHAGHSGIYDWSLSALEGVRTLATEKLC